MNSLKKGIFVWMIVSMLVVSCCFAKSAPVKRRMVLRLPFVQNQENSQNSFQQRSFLRMLNGGNSKIKKAADSESDDVNDDIIKHHFYMFRRII